MGLFDNGYISWLIIPIAMVYGCIYPQNWLIIFFLVKIERFDCGQARSHRFSSVGRCLGWERYRWYQLDNYQFSLAYPTDIQSRPILAYLSIFDFNFDGPIQVAILESSQDQFESSEQIFPYISTYFHIFPYISIYFHIYIHICPYMSTYYMSIRARHCHSAIWICADSGEPVWVSCDAGSAGSGTSPVVKPTTTTWSAYRTLTFRQTPTMVTYPLVMADIAIENGHL